MKKKLKQPVLTTNDIFVVASFPNISVTSFFYSNGDLCVKMDDTKYLRIDANKRVTTVIEWDKTDFVLANVAEQINFCYKRNNDDKNSKK